MAERLQRTESEFKHIFEQNQANDSLISIAKEKVGIAEKETQEASSKVSDLLASVQEIIDELENLPNIDEEALNQLQEKYKMAEDCVKEAKLDEKLAALQQQQDIHNSLIADYEKEIMRLQKDVDNIEQIARALPDGCFNRVELEPQFSEYFVVDSVPVDITSIPLLSLLSKGNSNILVEHLIF
ncbi:hypothetical protein WA026_012398 [Henosepilachna vigintioctopunctata]|uniref:Uncharacterized protein n=1 Tax=Henosepilachna vigintioctopunctata TaxID=420089 RepID=A0AAW1UR53_9CUCU